MLKDISTDLQKRYNVLLKFSEEAELFLADKGYSPEYGARELRRIVEKYVQMPLSNLILSGKFKGHKSWHADLENGGIAFIP